MKKLLSIVGTLSAILILFNATSVNVQAAGTCVCTGGSCTTEHSSVLEASQAECTTYCQMDVICGPSSTGTFTANSNTNNAPGDTKGLKGATGIFQEAGKRAGFTQENPLPPEVVVGQIIKSIILLIGVLFGVLVVYAGYLWMAARGNDEYVKRAKQILENAIIGLVIVIGAYAITTFVVERIITAAYK